MKSKVKEIIFDPTVYKFAIVGVLNTCFGMTVMFIFYNCFHFSYWVSSASNYIFGSILSYVLNRLFTFKSTETTKKTLPKFAFIIIVSYLIAYGGAKPFILFLLKESSVAVQDNVAMLTGTLVFIVLNYFGQRFIVFKYRKPER